MASSEQSAVQVRVGVRRPSTRPTAVPRMVVLGLGPRTSRWLSDAYPAAVVHAPRRSAQGAVVEHLRFGHRQDLSGLPGLNTRYPSLVRDAVAIGLEAGATSVDLLLARVPGARPWELEQPEVLDVLSAPLESLPGTLVTVPDVVGPVPVLQGGARDPAAIEDRLVRVARGLAPTLRAAWQVGMLDCPAELVNPQLMARLVDTDLALWAWSGPGPAIARQGWRSAAAAAAGMNSGRTDLIYRGKTRQTFALGPGRQVRRRQAREADRPQPRESSLNALMLDKLGTSATVLSERCLRAPVGEWDVATLRTVKLLHRRIRLAADEFVFRPVTSAESMALAAALDIVLRPFVQAGLLTGPGGKGTPVIRGEADRNPSAPSLVAEIGASLRPWAQRLNVRVGVDPGVSATVELRA